MTGPMNEPLPEPARTSLIVAIAFSLGALFAFYAQDYEAELMACFPKSYSDIAPALPMAVFDFFQRADMKIVDVEIWRESVELPDADTARMPR